MKIVKLAVAASALMAGAVAMGGTASAGSLSAERTTARTAHPAAQTAATGAWSKAHVVPGLATLNKGHGAGMNQVSCASAGNCAAGGFFRGAHGDGAFLAGQSTAAR